jgi:hypothetical protein
MTKRKRPGQAAPAVRQPPLNRGDEHARAPSAVRRMFSLGLVLLSAAALIGAHVYVAIQGFSYRGPLLILDHLFDLSLALALLALCAGVGRFVLKPCGATFDPPLEDLSFSMAVGSGILAASILVCGAVSALRAPVLVLLLLAWAVLARREAGALPTLCRQAGSELRLHGGITSLCAFAVVGVLVIAQAMAPPTEWDSLMYHLRVPAQFLQAGRIYLPDDGLHVPFVGLVHMLYVPLLALGSSAGPALVSAVLTLMLGVAVLSFCARFLDRPTGALSPCLLWGSTVLLMTAITSRVDVTLAWYLFLAQYALLMTLSGPWSPAHFYLPAALLGFAVGVKYLALAYVVALVPLILWIAYSRAGTRRASVYVLLVFVLVAIGGALPWLVKNWVLFGSPLYPILGERRLAPWLAALYGSYRVPPTVDQTIFTMFTQLTARFNLVDLFWAPARLAVEREADFYFFSPPLLLLPLWLLFPRHRTLSWLSIGAIGYALVVVASYPNARYLIPAVAPLTIVTTYVIVRLVTRFCHAKLATALLVVLTGLALARSGQALYSLFDRETLGYLGGTSSSQEYLDRRMDPYAKVVAFANQHLPKDSRTVMLFEARGYYFTRPVIQDNDVTSWPLLAPKAAGGDCLRGTGISHLLVNSYGVVYYLKRGLDERLLQLPALRELTRRCLTPVYAWGGLILFEVRR